MKKKIIMVALFAFALFATASASIVQTLTINGEKVEKVVSRLTFDGDNVVLLLDDTEVSYPMNDVEIAFSTTTSINGISTFRINGLVDDVLNISGLTKDTVIAIYDTTGKKLVSAKADGDAMHVALRGFSSGVYIMKVGNSVVKFIKR